DADVDIHVNDPLVDFFVQQRTIRDDQEARCRELLPKRFSERLQCLPISKWFAAPEFDLLRFAGEPKIKVANELLDIRRVTVASMRNKPLRAVFAGVVARQPELDLHRSDLRNLAGRRADRGVRRSLPATSLRLSRDTLTTLILENGRLVVVIEASLIASIGA